MPRVAVLACPRDHVRKAGPLNQFRICVSFKPNCEKTLYWTCTVQQRTCRCMRTRRRNAGWSKHLLLASHREEEIDATERHPIDESLPVAPLVPYERVAAAHMLTHASIPKRVARMTVFHDLCVHTFMM